MPEVDAPFGAEDSPNISQPQTVQGTESERLDGIAAAYLERLLKNIVLMLGYVNDNGISLPDDLRAKIDALLNDPRVRGSHHAHFFSYR